MNSTWRLQAWHLLTACKSLHWHILDGATSRSPTAARASWHCPRDCRLHCGHSAVCWEKTGTLHPSMARIAATVFSAASK
jgi:hypothetical protein